MTKNRWWTQLVKNEYPETQTSYGQDLNALTGFRGKVNSPSKIERRSLKIKCDKCGTEHWVDKP